MSARVVVADPPWPERGGGKCKRGADRHYALMSLAEIEAHMREHVPSTTCALFIWTTSSHLAAAVDLGRALGFRYVSSRVWVKLSKHGKPCNGLGQHARQRHEFLLLFARGRIEVPPTHARPSSVIEAPRGRHSQKPAQVYDEIRAAYEGPFLEMFAVDERKGWEQHGDRQWSRTRKEMSDAMQDVRSQDPAR